jgi:GTP pyrophosphokinase
MLTTRFEQALQYAIIVHTGQVRKGTQIPYISHLLAVTSIVLEHGATEDEAIGALLHDAGEDAGGEARIADIAARFGDAVAAIVRGCSDTTTTDPKPPWRQRKEAYIAHLHEASAAMILASAADKLHNARAILHDYHTIGDALWQRFNAGKAGTLWYYRAVTDALRVAPHNRCPQLLAELDRVVTHIEVGSVKLEGGS